MLQIEENMSPTQFLNTTPANKTVNKKAFYILVCTSLSKIVFFNGVETRHVMLHRFSLRSESFHG